MRMDPMKDGRRHPCMKDCPRREPGCHAKCEAYQRYAAARAEIYEARAKEYDAQAALHDMEVGWAMRALKDRRRRKR